MKIKNHDDFPKLDHRTAPSFWAERDWVIDSPPIPRARPGNGRHDQLGNFQTALLGRITPASTHADARSRCRAPLDPAPPDRPPREAWPSSCGGAARGAGRRACTDAAGDAIDPVTVDLLRTQIEAERLAHHPGEEPSDRVLLPMGRAHNGSDRRSL